MARRTAKKEECLPTFEILFENSFRLSGELYPGLAPNAVGNFVQLANSGFYDGAAITLVEFAVGCTVNLWLGWGVWNYANVPGNVLGQICLPFSLIWLLLCAAACPICRRLAGCFPPSCNPRPKRI